MISPIDGWNTKRISDLAENVYAGATPNTKIEEYWENGNIPWMSSGEINNEIIHSTKGFITKTGFDNSSTKIVPINSVLIALAGQGKTRGKVAINKIELCTNQSLAAIIPNDQVFYKYLYYNLQFRYFELRELSSGDGGRGGLNLKLINGIQIALPPLQEQKKIAEILSTWDDAITLYSNIIRTFDEYKQSLIQKIIIDEQSIFKTKKVKIRNLLKERTDKSDGNEEVHSVSVKRGIINQIEHLGRVFAAKDTSKYNLVKYGDIVYTKSPTGDFPFGIIKQSYIHENVIVSPLYGVYEPINYHTGKYLNAFFESAIRTNNMLAPIIQKGAKNTINITNDRFLDGKIKFPHNESTIILISKIIDEVDKILVKYESMLFLVEKQKQGLMQLLLTGKIRVNVN